jgi:hypothetical protein
MTATDIATAAFVLKEAEAAGYAFASNGIELVTKEPTSIPRESRRTDRVFISTASDQALIVDTYPIQTRWCRLRTRGRLMPNGGRVTAGRRQRAAAVARFEPDDIQRRRRHLV